MDFGYKRKIITTLNCPCLRMRLTDCFCSESKCSIKYLDIVSVSRNFDNFVRPVEGAMKLLRPCINGLISHKPQTHEK